MAAPDADDPLFPGSETISVETAERRCATSEWVEERDWLRAVQAQDSFASETASDPPVSVAELRRRREPLIEALRARFVHATVSEDEEDNPGFGMHLRLGEGTIYKVGPTVRNGMADLLAGILRLLTGSKYFGLLAAWTGFAVWKLVKTLLDGFERLENPVEREVFEKLFALSGRLAVVDYSALNNCDYDHAYSRIAPTAEEIAAECSARSHAEVEAALRAMEKREILVRRNDRWSVRF